jgi:hypothetical protein
MGLELALVSVFWVGPGQSEETRPQASGISEPLKAHPLDVESFGGLWTEPDWSTVAGIRKLERAPRELARAELLHLLEEKKTRPARVRLEILKSLHAWLRGEEDYELVVATLRIFEVEDRPPSPLSELVAQRAAMVLARTQGKLAQNALSAALDDTSLSPTKRKAAKLALASKTGSGELEFKDFLNLSESPEMDRVKLTMRPLAEGESISQIETRFTRGEHWLAFRLAESLPLSGRSEREAIRLSRILAWLESDELVLRLGAAAGLGRRAEKMVPSRTRRRIMSALGEQYLVEPEVRVRRALVAALARVQEPDAQVFNFLAVARELDPDPVARALAGEKAEGLESTLNSTGRSTSRQRASRAPRAEKQGDFAVDGTPCFTSEQCRVLPDRGVDVPRLDP